MELKLSESSQVKLRPIVAALNHWPKKEIDAFLKKHPDKALGLILTLKHFANPLAYYPTDDEVITELNIIQSCIDNPENLPFSKKLKPTLSTLIPSEKIYLSGLLQLKLDFIARQIMSEKKISEVQVEQALLTRDTSSLQNIQKMPDRLDNSADAWWNSLSKEKQNEVETRYQSLNSEQKQHLEKRVYHFYGRRPAILRLHQYQMCIIHTELICFEYRDNNYFTTLAILSAAQGIANVAELAATTGRTHRWHHWHHSHRSHHRSTDTGNPILGLAAIALFIGFVVSGAVAGIYALKKTFNSLRNIFTGKKPLRSITRLLGMGSGAYLGVIIGGMVGAIIGSLIPGGTALGFVIGMAFGAAIGSGTAALIVKYIMKAISALLNPHELNPTNPDKWRLSQKEMYSLKDRGIDIAEVNKEIRAIKQKKDALPRISASLFWTKERKEKNFLNKELERVKKCDFYPPRYHLFCAPTLIGPDVTVEKLESCSTSSNSSSRSSTSFSM